MKIQHREIKNVSKVNGKEFNIEDGSILIAAITSCTNTSNPNVLIGAGLLAKKAVELGLKTKPWVKTSLAPGSKVVTDYLKKSGLNKYLDKLGFNLVGYGCTTCIGNSGPLPENIVDAIEKKIFMLYLFYQETEILKVVYLHILKQTILLHHHWLLHMH